MLYFTTIKKNQIKEIVAYYITSTPIKFKLPELLNALVMTRNFNTDLFNVSFHYLQALQINITATSLKKALQENPYYPSLFGLSKVFNRFHIDTQALRVKVENLSQLRTPFITYLENTSTGSDFVLVTEITETHISYQKEGNKSKKIARQDFVNDFKEIVFVAEKNAASGEKEYLQNLGNEKKAKNKKGLVIAGLTLIVLSVLFLFFYPFQPVKWGPAILVLIKLTGLCFAILLLLYDLDKTNSMVKKICSINKESGCDAVLNSKKAGILGIKWSDIGLFYFVSTLLFLLFPGLSFAGKLPWLAIASTAAAPYILFSIYYQWKVVKHWCPLCLAVQFVLFAELIWSVFSFWTSPGFLPVNPTILIPVALFCVLVPIVVLHTFKPLILESKKREGYEAAYKRLLYSPGTFNSLLDAQASIHEGWEQLGISLGNPAAENTIVKVCNPYCGPCAKAHRVLEEILSTNDKISLQIIFTPGHNNRNSEVVKHLMTIAAKENMTETKKALDDWYMNDKKDYASFASRHPLDQGMLASQDEMLAAMNNWCNEAKITGTPTIFINGKKMPDDYDIEELKYIL
jgi:uncharacterized membrane protein